MKLIEIKYFDHELEQIMTIEFEGTFEDIEWQLRKNDNDFFFIDTDDVHKAIRLEDIKSVDFIEK